MRRLAAVPLLLLAAVLPGLGKSTAATSTTDPPTTTPLPTATLTTFNGFCFSGTVNQLVPCPVTPVAIPPQAAPVKSISITNGVAMPAGTTQYEVDVTSKLACFPLPEPTSLYLLPADGSSVLTELFPAYMASQSSSLTLTVDQTIGGGRSGTAVLSLEIFNRSLRTPNVAVKAVWAKEKVEQIAAAVPLPTLAPNQPTAPPQIIETSTPIPRLNVTTTPTPVPAPAAQPAPTVVSGGLPVRVCLDSNQLQGATLGGDFPVLWGLTVPGATCFPYVRYSTGEQPGDTNYLAGISGQKADSAGLVRFTWHEQTQGRYGVARVTCIAGSGAIGSACQGFIVNQSDGILPPPDIDVLLKDLNSGQPCPLTIAPSP